jgi:hypothetical protein
MMDTLGMSELFHIGSNIRLLESQVTCVIHLFLQLDMRGTHFSNMRLLESCMSVPT